MHLCQQEGSFLSAYQPADGDTWNLALGVARPVLVRVPPAPLQKAQVYIRILPVVIGGLARSHFESDDVS